MSATGPSLIRPLTPNDIPFAQQVRELAGWNQTDTDWKRLLKKEPEGCFLIKSEGSPAGTATTTIHGGEVGWIGMVLVHPDYRRRGLATQLLLHCIQYLQPRVQCIKLDATPAGKQVYEKLGFVDESGFHRWEGVSSTPTESLSSSTKFAGEDWSALLDRRAFGADRTDYLQLLFRDSHHVVVKQEHGFGMLRLGSHASYLGPVVTDSPETGIQITQQCLNNCPTGPVYWDLPDENLPATELATELGFSKQRSLLRMRLGDAGHEGDLSLQWAIGAPETG